MWAWLRMLHSVPTGISRVLGTIAVSTTSSCRRTNFTWLPFWLASEKPAASSRRLTSRKGRGLSRANLHLDRTNLRRTRRVRRFEVKLQCLSQVFERLFFGGSLAGYIHLETLRDVPTALTPNRGGERSLHASILAYG